MKFWLPLVTAIVVALIAVTTLIATSCSLPPVSGEIIDKWREPGHTVYSWCGKVPCNTYDDEDFGVKVRDDLGKVHSRYLIEERWIEVKIGDRISIE